MFCTVPLFCQEGHFSEMVNLICCTAASGFHLQQQQQQQQQHTWRVAAPLASFDNPASRAQESAKQTHGEMRILVRVWRRPPGWANCSSGSMWFFPKGCWCGHIAAVGRSRSPYSSGITAMWLSVGEEKAPVSHARLLMPYNEPTLTTATAGCPRWPVPWGSTAYLHRRYL